MSDANQFVQQLIADGLPCEHVQVQGDGRHFFALIVSSAFEGLRLVQRHKKVYDTLGGRMATDEVHALSMKTFTPSEWQAAGRPLSV
jgi:acid stress-induced BolA-like protein IbaG/YrbA